MNYPTLAHVNLHVNLGHRGVTTPDAFHSTPPSTTASGGAQEVEPRLEAAPQPGLIPGGEDPRGVTGGRGEREVRGVRGEGEVRGHRGQRGRSEVIGGTEGRVRGHRGQRSEVRGWTCIPHLIVDLNCSCQSLRDTINVLT